MQSANMRIALCIYRWYCLDGLPLAHQLLRAKHDWLFMVYICSGRILDRQTLQTDVAPSVHDITRWSVLVNPIAF